MPEPLDADKVDGTHAHVCRKCEHRWVHGQKLDDEAAHTCKVCGFVEWVQEEPCRGPSEACGHPIVKHNLRDDLGLSDFMTNLLMIRDSVCTVARCSCKVYHNPGFDKLRASKFVQRIFEGGKEAVIRGLHGEEER